MLEFGPSYQKRPQLSQSRCPVSRVSAPVPCRPSDAASNHTSRDSHITENTTYATRAVKLTNAFFLDPVTGMRPNLNFGQLFPGVGEPFLSLSCSAFRGIGIEPFRAGVRSWLHAYGASVPLPIANVQDLATSFEFSCASSRYSCPRTLTPIILRRGPSVRPRVCVRAGGRVYENTCDSPLRNYN